MMTKRTLDIGANILALIMCGFVIVRLIVPHSTPSLQTTQPYKPGEHISRSSTLQFGGPHRTVLLVNRSGCGFCTASMPFYRSLVTAATAVGDTVISVTPEQEQHNNEYLRSFGVNVSAVISLANAHVKAFATPTLIVVGKDGIVINSWVGKLDKAAQRDVLAALKANSSQS